ncbi:MAG TPA: hypothetical protein VIV11_16640 [Kofleriaceae bacterium]
MDDEARAELIVQAKLQNAHSEIKRARANMPIGVVLIAIGLAITIGVAMLPLGLVGKVLIAGIGFVFIPGGIAVLVRSAGAISRGNREIRELGPPTARVVK